LTERLGGEEGGEEGGDCNRCDGIIEKESEGTAAICRTFSFHAAMTKKATDAEKEIERPLADTLNGSASGRSGTGRLGAPAVPVAGPPEASVAAPAAGMRSRVSAGPQIKKRIEIDGAALARWYQPENRL